MNLKTILLTVLVTLSTSLFSQRNDQTPPMSTEARSPQQRPPFSPKEFMERMESFIIKEVGLTPTEAQFLFPLFHESKQKQREISTKIQALMKKGREGNLSEAEYLSILEQIEKLQFDKLKIEQSYNEKYRKVISNKKLLAIMSASTRFDRRMLKQMFRHDGNRKKEGNK